MYVSYINKSLYICYVNKTNKNEIDMKNKLLFTLERDFNEDIIIVCDNERDLLDYLTLSYDWYNITIGKDYVHITEMKGYSSETATIKWIKHI